MAHALVEQLTTLASKAGAAILAHRGAQALGKSDGSLVCMADMAADDIIRQGLAQMAPTIPVVSEESLGGQASAPAELFFLIDPLDGTREFLAGSAEFTVNIAIIRQNAPILGIVYAPASGALWLAARGEASKRMLPAGKLWGNAVDAQVLKTRPAPAQERIGMRSVSHALPGDTALGAKFGVTQWEARGSALKFTAVAEGVADIYPREGTIMAWDMAAGHAVLEAAGGCVIGLDGAPMRYGVPGMAWRQPGFLAAGDPSLVRGGVRS